MNLYTVPAEYQAWLLAVEDSDGEVTPALAARLDAIEGTLAEKADAVCALIRGARAEAATCRTEAAWWARKARVAEGRADRLRDLLLRAMAALSVPEVRGRRFTVVVRPAAVPRIRWAGEGEIPEWCRKVTVELDARKAREGYLRGGAPMEGFAVDYPEYLTIR